MNVLQQYRPIPTVTQPKRRNGILFLLGILGILFGVIFLLKLSGLFRLPIPIDDRILQYATSVFSIVGGFYMIYKALWRPRIYI